MAQSNQINLIALEDMIKKMRFMQERFPNNIIAGVIFADPKGIFVLPTVDSEAGMQDLKDTLLVHLTEGEFTNRKISSNDN